MIRITSGASAALRRQPTAGPARRIPIRACRCVRPPVKASSSSVWRLVTSPSQRRRRSAQPHRSMPGAADGRRIEDRVGYVQQCLPGDARSMSGQLPPHGLQLLLPVLTELLACRHLLPRRVPRRGFAHCTDGQKDDGEEGVDCGGDCGPCPEGDACTTGSGCVSGICSSGACAAIEACARVTPPDAGAGRMRASMVVRTHPAPATGARTTPASTALPLSAGVGTRVCGGPGIAAAVHAVRCTAARRHEDKTACEGKPVPS